MSSTEAKSIRNIAFVGHPSSGKTTLIDALAHITGASSRNGSVADGTSICDTEPEEQDKKHTLQLAVVHAEHGDKHWTFLDTPGYPDFIAEAQGAMFAADLVVAVVSCTSGITFNLRKKFETASQLARPRAIVVTHLDAENADFDTLVEELRDSLGEVCVPVLLPDASGAGFSALQRTFEVEDSPWRQRLMDRVMDACEDEDLLMEYLESQTLTEDQLDQFMPHAIEKNTLVPVLVCNPDSGLGVENIYNYLKRFSPPPTEAEIFNEVGERVTPKDGGALVGTIFNVKSDPHVGKVCMARIWSGSMTDHAVLHGCSDKKPEKIGGLFQMVGKNRVPITKAGPGDIVAFSKVEHIAVGQPFTEGDGELHFVAAPDPPAPTVSLAIFPKTRADEQKIGEALHKLVDEDPTLQLYNDGVTHELVVSGMSDLHLQIMESRLKRRYGVEVETKLPRIAYRETIKRPAEGHHRHKKQSGGRGQFGECYIRLRPVERGTGNEFLDKVVGGSIPRNLIPAVQKGIVEACAEGVMTNSVVVDVAVELYDGKFHAVDSDEASFKSAAKRAFREGFEKAGPVLLEPVMNVEIHVPTSHAGMIFSDITSQRRGHVMDQDTEADGAITLIKAQVPLSTMQTYHRDLKSQTAGEGTYSMAFANYAKMPSDEQARVMKTEGKHHEEE
ncbi:MAG: elongation factor G [bacterium]|nr:elongation factor G [Planctomycetota bacterium]HIL51286.1 elongation factor G [Planctomycetota bacterium]